MDDVRHNFVVVVRMFQGVNRDFKEDGSDDQQGNAGGQREDICVQLKEVEPATSLHEMQLQGKKQSEGVHGGGAGGNHLWIDRGVKKFEDR